MILNEPNKMSEIHPLQLVTNLKYELILLLQDNSKMDRVMNNDSIDLYPMRKHFKKVMRRVRRKIQWRCLRVMNNLARVVATRDEMEMFLFCCNVKDTSVPSVAKYSPFHYACTKKYAMLATEMLRYNTRDEMLHDTTSSGRSALVICAMSRTCHMDRVFRLILRKTRDEAFLYSTNSGMQAAVLNLCVFRNKKSRVLSILRNTRNEDYFYATCMPPWFHTPYVEHINDPNYNVINGEIYPKNNGILLTMMENNNLFAAIRYILEHCEKLKNFENNRRFIITNYPKIPIHRSVLIGLRSIRDKCGRMRAVLEWKLRICLGARLHGDVLRVVAEFCDGNKSINTIDHLRCVLDMDAIGRVSLLM
jgi:hypothetical protein